MRILFILALVTATAGCSDDDSAWRFDEGAPDDINNTTPGPLPDPDPDPDSDPEPCSAQSLQLGPATLLSGNPQQPGRTLVQTSLGTGSVTENELRLWHPQNGEVTYSLGAGGIVAGAGGPSVMTIAFDDPERPYFAHNVVNETEPFQLAPTGPNLAFINTWRGNLPRFVDSDGTIAFHAEDRVMLWDTVEVFFVADASPYTLEVGESRIAWAEILSDGYTLTSWKFNESQTVRVGNQPINLEVIDEGLFWSTQVDSWWWPANGEPQLIGEECGPVAFDRTSRLAYYSCGETEDSSGHTIYQRTLDGTETPVASATQKPYGLTADGGIVVWAEYPPGAGTGSAEDRGVLFGWSPGMETPQELDDIGQGCLTCGAYWTPAEIALGNGLIGWTYAGGVDPAFPGREEHVEVREITRICSN